MQPAKHLTWEGRSERRYCNHHYGVYCAGQGLEALKPVELEVDEVGEARQELPGYWNMEQVWQGRIRRIARVREVAE
jgi:hypothetical protein